MKPICIYHGNCADGFGAAWVVRRYFSGNVDFHAGVYQEPPPDVTDRDVILVDFSYKRPVLEAMAQTAKSILILDHHKTAADDLRDFQMPDHCQPTPDLCAWLPNSGIAALFDMTRSGAGLAWDYFYCGIPRPDLINAIEDRDLWKFALPGTREIQASVFSYPYDFEVWDMLMSANLDKLRTEGAAIERKHHKDIAELVGVVTREMVIGGYTVPVANLPYTLTSDAGHLLAKGKPFAACYWDTPGGRVFSLRSTDEGLDVSEIAKGYGGGGHRNASGFRVSHDAAREMERAVVPQEIARNQCDGCARGLPVNENGIHYVPGASAWDGDRMVCTKDRYEKEPKP